MDKQNITKADIAKIRIPPGSRQVMIRIDDPNTEARTESGIYKISPTETDWNKARHSNRTGTIVKLPRDPLPFGVNKDEMPWETVVEISEGWICWFDFMASENAMSYIDEDVVEYKLIDYSDIFVAITDKYEGETFDEQETRDGKYYVRCLNGFCLFERVKKDAHKFSIHGDEGYDDNYGVVRYVAKKNTSYESGISHDHVSLKPGDKVRFSQVPMVLLEDETYCSFDGGQMYRRSQSRNVEMVWRDGQLILPDTRILVEQIADEDVTASGIILPRADVKNHTGRVVLSSHREVKEGEEVRYIINGGQKIDYEGRECRVLMESHILHIEEKG